MGLFAMGWVGGTHIPPDEWKKNQGVDVWIHAKFLFFHSFPAQKHIHLVERGILLPTYGPDPVG